MTARTMTSASPSRVARSLVAGTLMLASASIAQVTSTGLTFLRIPASIESHAMGRIFTLPNNSVLAARGNPSLPALQAFDTQVQGAFYAPATDWLPGFGTAITLSAQGLMFGFPIGGDSDPQWAVGVAFGRQYLDLGTFVQTLGSPEPTSSFSAWEDAHSLSAGLAYDGPVTLGVGTAFTFIRSSLAPFGTAIETPPGPTRATSWTFGLTARAPVTRLLGLERPVAGMTPFANIMTTLVISDVGGSVRYGDATQSDPLPRAATMGLSASAGVRSEFSGVTVRLIEFEILREAQDVLVERTSMSDPTWRYQTGLGDLHPISDLLVQSGNTIVEHRKGFRASFAESVTIMDGSYRDSGFDHIKTLGLAFSSRALFLILRTMVNGEGLATWVLDRVSLQYVQASYEAPHGHPLHGTDFQSFTITIHAPNPHAHL